MYYHWIVKIGNFLYQVTTENYDMEELKTTIKNKMGKIPDNAIWVYKVEMLYPSACQKVVFRRLDGSQAVMKEGVMPWWMVIVLPVLVVWEWIKEIFGMGSKTLTKRIPIKCSECNGTGKFTYTSPPYPAQFNGITDVCPMCGGGGELDLEV